MLVALIMNNNNSEWYFCMVLMSINKLRGHCLSNHCSRRFLRLINWPNQHMFWSRGVLHHLIMGPANTFPSCFCVGLHETLALLTSQLRPDSNHKEEMGFLRDIFSERSLNYLMKVIIFFSFQEKFFIFCFKPLVSFLPSFQLLSLLSSHHNGQHNLNSWLYGGLLRETG